MTRNVVFYTPDFLHIPNPPTRIVPWAVGWIGLLFVALPLFSQGHLAGRVTDTEGKPVSGVQVKVSPMLDAVQSFQVETDEQGQYRLENFNPGRAYRFLVFKEGYRTVIRNVESGLSGTSGLGGLEEDFTLIPIGVDPGGKESNLLIMERHSPGTEAYRKGNRWLDRGNFEKAKRHYESARRLDPELAPVYEGLSLVYHKLGEYESALEASDKALELSPWEPDYLRIRYDALNALGREEEGRQVLMQLAQAAADAGTANLFYNEGVTAVRRRDIELAISMFEAALRLNPGMTLATEALAKVYAEGRKYEIALALALEVLVEEPDNLELLRLRQEAASHLGRGEEAAAALEELVRRDPSPRTATLIYNQGVAAFNGGDLATAERRFRTALGVDEDHLQSRIGLAEVLLKAKRYSECLDLTEGILADHPGHGDAERIAERAKTRMGS